MKTKSNLHQILSFSACFTIALFAGCAAGPAIRTHADTAVSYENYHTFALMSPAGLAAAGNRDVTPMLIRQTRTEVESAFVAKGLAKAPPASADLLVLVRGAIDEKLDVKDWGFSYGRFGRGFGAMVGRYEVSQYKEGALLIDVFDAKTKELVWRGSAVSEVGEIPSPETIKTTVAAVVARYPD